MRFESMTPEELKQYKIVDGYQIHRNCLCFVIEAPSARNYPQDIAKKDHRYLTGVIWTFPFEYQLNMLEFVIDNKVRDKPRLKYINQVRELLDKLDPNNNKGPKTIPSPPPPPTPPDQSIRQEYTSLADILSPREAESSE